MPKEKEVVKETVHDEDKKPLTKKEMLINTLKFYAIQLNVSGYVKIVVERGFAKPQIIMDYVESFDEQAVYLDNAYTDDLKLKANENIFITKCQFSIDTNISFNEVN